MDSENVGADKVMEIMLQLIEGWDDEWEDACEFGSYDSSNEGYFEVFNEGTLVELEDGWNDGTNVSFEEGIVEGDNEASVDGWKDGNILGI